MKYIILFLILGLLAACSMRKIEIVRYSPKQRPWEGVSLREFYTAVKDDTINIAKKCITDNKVKRQIKRIIRKNKYYKLRENWFGFLFGGAISEGIYFDDNTMESMWLYEDKADSTRLLNVEYFLTISKRIKSDSIFIGDNALRRPNLMKYNQDYYLVGQMLHTQIGQIFEQSKVK